MLVPSSLSSPSLAGGGVGLSSPAANPRNRPADSSVTDAAASLLSLYQVASLPATISLMEGAHRVAGIKRKRSPTADSPSNIVNLEKEYAQWISAHNRRCVAPASIKGKLERALNYAQQFLETGANPRWSTCHVTRNVEVLRHSDQALKQPLPSQLHPLLQQVGVATAIGQREAMEDRYLVTVLNIQINGKVLHVPLYGVFDGHRGEACATFLQKNIGPYLTRQLAQELSAIDDHDYAIFNILKRAFVELGAQYRREQPEASAGSTANIALIIKKHLWVANVGDSRAVMSVSRRPMALSVDAKPGNAFDRSVIKRRGVFRDRDANGRNARRAGKIGGWWLNMTRAVGYDEIQAPFNPRAKIVKYALKSNASNLLIIASDGLWSMASSSQVAKSVASASGDGRDCASIAQTLIRKALTLGSRDNISVIVAKVKPVEE